ncbi:putative urease accessory protein UreF-like protein [Cladorrhinum sp. PSN332]|nr:putative urease accessory protein UreF-like protein [Cladorrhinum sp. PSN332]
MISWALKRNSDNARDATAGGGGGEDTTQLDIPDTPAPVFAVRALKTALFGSPAQRERKAAMNKKKNSKLAHQNSVPISPPRPPGILLTPGTGTSRRKRVSFGHDVKQGSGGPARSSASSLSDEPANKAPTAWNDRPADTPIPRPKTRLLRTMEDARSNRDDETVTDTKDFAGQAKDSEDAWEEHDDESDFDNDITTDLNEPHSRSGKYWKSYFETYHADAKAELEKLVKYKHLVKSYAKQKDTEALDLAEKLREEQDKVKEMESKIAEVTRQVAIKKRRNGGESDTRLMDELSKQTELAREYKIQVEELEDLLRGENDELDSGGIRKQRTSPRTQQTILETQRELRKARSQLRELENLREERDRLRSDLKFSEQRANKLAEENRKLSSELTKSSSKVQGLEKNLEETQNLYAELKENTKKRLTEALQVSEKKGGIISGLQKEIESLKRGDSDSRRALPSRTSLDDRPRSSSERLAALRAIKTEEENAQRLKELQGLEERAGSQKKLPSSATTTESRSRVRRPAEGYKSARRDEEDETLKASRALREKIETELGRKSTQAVSAALADRGNKPESRDSASSTQSSHEEFGPPPSRTDRRARSSWTGSTAVRGSRDSLGRLSGENGGRETRISSRASLEHVGARRSATRPLSVIESEAASPEIDLVQDKYARLGGTATATNTGQDPNNSAVWTTAINASQVKNISESRKAAAIARLQRRRAERELKGRRRRLPPSPSHFLLLLSDSALPLGSFAFSSGLESYLAHHKHFFSPSPSSPSSSSSSSSSSSPSFNSFLPLSISSYASTTLPFLLAAHRNPSFHSLASLDDIQDASIICTVGRRASIAQGRALLGIWERSFQPGFPATHSSSAGDLKSFSRLVKKSSGEEIPTASAHLAPLFGAICRLVGLTAQETAYVFLLGHVKALVSAAVRAGMFGPYQAQKTLSSGVVQGLIDAMVEREWETPVEVAGQNVPVMDLWFGRHEMLYSRIFNS